MKFELTYADLSKVVVEVSEAEVREWLANYARSKARAQAEKAQEAKGAVTAAQAV